MGIQDATHPSSGLWFISSGVAFLAPPTSSISLPSLSVWQPHLCGFLVPQLHSGWRKILSILWWWHLRFDEMWPYVVRVALDGCWYCLIFWLPRNEWVLLAHLLKDNSHSVSPVAFPFPTLPDNCQIWLHACNRNTMLINISTCNRETSCKKSVTICLDELLGKAMTFSDSVT